MKDLFARPALSAAIVFFAGSALAAGTAGQPAQTAQAGTESGITVAQSGTNAPPGGYFPERRGGTPTPKNGRVGPDKGADPSADALDIPTGTEVVNAEGRKIGEVAGVSGDHIIISVDEYLGMGERQVVLNRDQLQIASDGARLQTTLSTEELQRLPQHGGAAPSAGDFPEREGRTAPPGGDIPERRGGAPAPTE